jgi:hypothetical protein
MTSSANDEHTDTKSEHDDGRHDGDHGDDRLVEIFVNDPNKPVFVPREVTGAAIKVAAGVDPAFDLFRVQGDHEIPVGNDKTITVRKGERFIATPQLDPS